MKIIKYPKEDLVIIKEGDLSVNFSLSKLIALLNDKEKMKILIDGRGGVEK